MATARSLPYEAHISEFMRIVKAAQREIALQVTSAIDSGQLERASQRRLQLARVIATLDQLGAYVDPAARKLVADAYTQGAERAATQIAGLSITAPEVPGAFAGVSTEAVQALQRSITGSLQAGVQTVGRQVDDVYAREGRAAALRAILGAEGSPQAARRQLALSLRKRGLTGFVDRAGRRWKLDTYAEMAVRTVTREAVVQGSLARMASHGITLARVSFHATSCPVCKPFEDRLVSLDGNVSEYEGEAVMNTGEVPPYHPNCAHSLQPVAVRVDAVRRELAAR